MDFESEVFIDGQSALRHWGGSASFSEEWFLAPFPFPKQGEQVDLARLRTVVAETLGTP